MPARYLPTRQGEEIQRVDGGWTACYVRRARKVHRCTVDKRSGAWCRAWDHGPLPPGHTGEIQRAELYVENLDQAYAYHSGDRYCAACSIAAGLITEEQP